MTLRRRTSAFLLARVADSARVDAVAAAASTTSDTLLGGALRLLQPKSGYRINIDSLLLVGFDGEALHLDLAREKLRESALPLVLCNPPYFPAHSHRPAQTPAKAAARSGDVLPFLKAAAALLARKTGRALFSYPAPQLPELLQHATAVGLVSKRLRLVHARADQPARLALIELRAARPGGLVIEPPLVEWIGRKRSPELLRLSADPAADRK
jgi:hypothetical protein